jgi:arsenite-transporting ATPase
MGEKHRYILAHLRDAGWLQMKSIVFLRDLSQRIEAVRKLLHDREQTSFTLVTIPEAMSVRETERYLELLTEQGVPVKDLIVNRVEQEHDACEYCRARVQMQQPWIKEIARRFRDLKIHYLPCSRRKCAALTI